MEAGYLSDKVPQSIPILSRELARRCVQHAGIGCRPAFAPSISEPFDASVVPSYAKTIRIGKVARVKQEPEFLQYPVPLHDLLDRGDQPRAVMRPVDSRANPSSICEIQGDPSRLGGLSPETKQLLDVLLQERNQKVMAELEDEVKELGRQDSIAVFFGTGHMPDLEHRLREELHYRPAGQLWLTAFSVDLAQTKITPSERSFLHDLLKHQLEQLQSRQAK